MAIVARSYLHMHYRAASTDQLLSLADIAFDKAKIAGAEFFPQWAFKISASTEEASLKTRTKIAITASALYIGIGNFGSFVDGVREIASLGRRAARFANEHIVAALPKPPRIIHERNDSGLPGELARLFDKVENGELTAREASARATLLLMRLEEPVPGAMLQDLQESLAGLRRTELAGRDVTMVSVPPPKVVRVFAASPSRDKPHPKGSRRMRAEVWLDEGGKKKRRIIPAQ
jgi:hypothetical protein